SSPLLFSSDRLLPSHIRSSLFFSITLFPPPISTLFPYTTLFRSPLWPLWSFFLAKKSFSPRSLYCVSDWAQGGETKSYFRGRAIDRKSTRLNSSHEWMSYAVFCLKKKRRISEA